MNDQLESLLMDLYCFVCDCCMSGDLYPEDEIAPMDPTDKRTLGDVLAAIQEQAH